MNNEEKDIPSEVNLQDEEIKVSETEKTDADTEKSNTDGELAEMKDKYLRMYSEFENFKRRTSKEKLEFFQTANRELMVSLLPVLDDFERATKSFEGATDIEAVKSGVSLIYGKLYKQLEAKGLKPLDSQGKLFDSEYHEAITQIPAPSEELKGKVVDEIEKGYFLNDKLIRFAKVVIGA